MSVSGRESSHTERFRSASVHDGQAVEGNLPAEVDRFRRNRVVSDLEDLIAKSFGHGGAAYEALLAAECGRW